MTLLKLISTIGDVHQTFQSKAIHSVSISLTLRNFVIGYYIVEYEQNGEDRANYGSKLIENMAKKLSHIKGMSSTSLKLMRQFYLTYPQISQSVTDQFKLENKISQLGIDLSLKVPTDKLLKTCSFTHFIELIKIDDELKRTFYEVETIKGNWSVRELRRQVESLLYERIGLSLDKKFLLQSIEDKKEVFNPASIIKEPYILEFTGLEIKEKYNENDNPPIGIVLCTEKNNVKVEYATAGLDENIFVSKYKIVLPSIRELENLIKEDLEEINN